MKTASYCPRPADSIRCFNLLSKGRTSNAGTSAGSILKPIGLKSQILHSKHLKPNSRTLELFRFKKETLAVNVCFIRSQENITMKIYYKFNAFAIYQINQEPVIEYSVMGNEEHAVFASELDLVHKEAEWTTYSKEKTCKNAIAKNGNSFVILQSPRRIMRIWTIYF